MNESKHLNEALTDDFLTAVVYVAAKHGRFELWSQVLIHS